MSASTEELLLRYRERFDGFPDPLFLAFEESLRSLDKNLSHDELISWVEAGMSIMQTSLRSWEAAAEYFRASSLMPEETTWQIYKDLGDLANDLTAESAPLAVAFLKSAPKIVDVPGFSSITDWGILGRSLYKGNWKSSSLAGQFFEASPDLLGILSNEEAGRLVEFLDELARHSYELAASCLSTAAEVLGTLDEADRLPYLSFGLKLTQTSWADSRIYFERGAPLIKSVNSPSRDDFLQLATRVAEQNTRAMLNSFESAAAALGQVSGEYHRPIVELAHTISQISPIAAMDFISNTPTVLEKIRIEALPSWHESGLNILESSLDGGEAYFRLQSSRGEDVLEKLSARIELTKVGEILRLYAKALTGRDVSVQSTVALTEKGIGWVDEHVASTEGSSIYVPVFMERYSSKEENFAALKVFVTHQAAHLEFGSFDFDLKKPATLFTNLREELLKDREEENSGFVTPFERFFDLFQNRQLGSDLYEISEDARIDAAIKREYGGIRRALNQLQGEEVQKRPEISELPLRQAFVENLLRVSLDGLDAVRWPKNKMEVMGQGIGILGRLTDENAIVEDAAEAALRLYNIALSIPNKKDEDDSEWSQMDLDDEMFSLDSTEMGEGTEQLQSGEEIENDADYESPEDVDFRGDFKPELVQLLMNLRDDLEMGEGGDFSQDALTEEQLAELLEKSADLDLDALLEGDLETTTGMFLSNLLKEAGTPISEMDMQGNETKSDNSTGEEEGEEPLVPVITTYYYDEWDFRAHDYKPRWCAVQEQALGQGDEDFYEEALLEHSGLVAQTRKQFELMKPELFRKMKKLADGEDIDLDPAIEWMVDIRAGVTPAEKIYWRRNKIERDVAIAFLLDMSASTDEEIAKRERPSSDVDDDPRKYLSWWVSKRRQEMSEPPKRIIDLEKEATVLLITALETIGDEYGIYGFSGYGRDNVEFFVIKDFKEVFGPQIKKRIDQIAPIRSTRMGPAIRHATTKLNETGAKVKILFLLSDGRPQDHGYGRDRTEKEYAIHDTKQALNEAKRDGITPFALTVDRAGHDYLKTMCEDMGYEVVADIESLPYRLPALYRRLTE